MKKRVLLWVIVILGLGLLVYGLTKLPTKPADDTNTSDTPATLTDITSSDHVEGPMQAKVTLIEYGDYQCPACGSYYTAVRTAVGDYKDTVRFVYRNFPLYQIHKNAKNADYAAEAAAKQGKYWEMHNMLFEKQTEWSESTDAKEIFHGYAIRLGLNSEQYEKDFGSSQIHALVDSHYSQGTRVGIESTPSFFLNGKKIQPGPTYPAFRAVIEEALAATK